MKLLILTQKIDKKDPVLGYFIHWIEVFSENTDKVTVICLYKGENPLPKNIKVLSLGKEESQSKLKYIFRFYKYIWVERNNYDNIFVHMNQIYIVLGGIFWRLWNKKIGLWYLHKSVTLSLRIAEKLTHVIFTGSKESFRLKSNKVNITGQGVDTDNFRPVKRKDTSNLKIISVGRISPIKNFETLINAVKILKDDGLSNIKAEIIGAPGIGEEDYFEALKFNLIDNKISNMVSFLGPIENHLLPRYIGEADIFVNSSGTGSLDKTGIEAMSMGLILLTSNEAYTDVLKDFPELMFEKNNHIELAEKIKNISKMNLSERVEFGEKLRAIVKNKHNLESLIKSIVNKY